MEYCGKTADTSLIYVPVGMTSLVQPLDVCILHPFKLKFKELMKKWATDKSEEFKIITPAPKKTANGRFLLAGMGINIH